MTYFNKTAYRVTDGDTVYAKDLNNPLSAIETGFASLAEDIQTGSLKYAVDTGTADEYACSLDPAISSYSEGLEVWLLPNATNTGASTLNINALGAIPILRIGLEPLTAGDLAANYYVHLKYSNGSFQIVSNVGTPEAHAQAYAVAASGFADDASGFADDASGFADDASGFATAASGFADAAELSAISAAAAVGAIPDASTAVKGVIKLATEEESIGGTDDVKAITSSTIRSAFSAGGSAPVYACRAWVNFNGAGTVAIRASGNVSSITDNGTGDYTVNFISDMEDANYSANINTQSSNFSIGSSVSIYNLINISSQLSSSVRIDTYSYTGSTNTTTSQDLEICNVQIIR